jgi:hypothetical protein
VNQEGNIFWLSRASSGPGPFFKTTGGYPVRISTDAIEQQVASFESPEDVQAVSFRENGQLFCQWSFTAANRTLLYNETTGEWYDRMMLDRSRHIACSYCYYDNVPYVLSYNDNKLYRMSPELLTDSGLPIYRERTSAMFFLNNQKNITLSEYRQMAEMGIGVNGVPIIGLANYTQGAEPIINLQISRNGGVTFGNNHEKPLGRIGQFWRRLRWQKLGRLEPKAKLVLRVWWCEIVNTQLEDGVLTYEESGS